MRVTIAIMGVAAAALLVGAVPSSSQGSVEAASEPTVPVQTDGEFRGGLHPNPETGCIEIPDEPGEPPRVWPVDGRADADLDVVPPGEVNDDADGAPDLGTEPWPGQDFDLHAEPWPLCDAPDVSAVITEDGLELIEEPSR